MTDRIWEHIDETGIPEMPVIGKMQIRNALQPMQMEAHPHLVEFLLLYSGCKRMWVEDRHYDLQGGDLLIIFPGEYHGAENAVQNRSSMIYLLTDVPSETPGFCMLDEAERRILWERLSGLSTRKFQVPVSVRREVDRLYDSVNSDAPLRSARIRTLLMEFLFRVLDYSGAAENNLPPDIGTVIRYIREKRDEMPDISRLAALVNLSESRFKQKFKQATGVPPAEFIVREKINEARLLLDNSDRTVTSIAMDLGFSSSQHFSVLFKKYVGESPVQYRRKHEFVP